MVEDLFELQQENARLKRIVDLRQRYGIHFYVPHAKQDRFHSVGDITGRHCQTGNRGGKTKCGAAEDVAWLLGGRVWYKNAFDVMGVKRVDGVRTPYVARQHEGGVGHPLITRGIPQRPVKGLLLVNDWDKAKEIFTNQTGDYDTKGELFQLIPSDAIPKGGIHLSRGGHVDQIRVKRLTEYGGGESLMCIDTVESWKHAKMSAESSDWDFIHLDEPCPEKMFTGHRRGLVDRNGKFWINCTPLDEMWINDEFTPPGSQMKQSENGDFAFVKGDGAKPNRYVINWTIWDNPYNSDEAIAEFEAGLNREQRACRLEGFPLAMAGRVYREFVYDLHVLCDVPQGWADYHLPPLDYTVRVAWDVHQRLSQAILKVATAPNGAAFVYDEMFDEPLIEPCATRLSASLAGRNVVDQIIDPFACIPDPRDGSCILDDLDRYGLMFDKASKDLTLGVSKVKEKLNERMANGLPTISFSPRLKQTLFEFSHYVYDTEKNSPKDKDNHMMENLYRLILNGLSYVPPQNDDAMAFRREERVGLAEDLSFLS